MLANVVDVEHEMMRYALNHPRAAAIMFDFTAAFPSLDHEYLFGVLQDIGIPSGLVCFIKSLYDQHTGYIALGAGKGEIRITAGIRQGCPLSPLIFALVSDILLRRLMRLFPDNKFRAYADDLCMISSDVYRDVDRVTSIFEDFGCVSGLHLNFSKTQVVPLWIEDHKVVQRKLGMIHFKWYGAKVDSSAEYLGFRIGPGRGEGPWNKALSKYLQRAKEWGTVGLSLHYSVKIYNTYILPVLSFVAQLEEVPSTFDKVEKQAMAALIPGPNKWISPDAVKSLHRGYGMPCEARDFRIVSAATKLRVAANEDRDNGGLRMKERRHELYMEVDKARRSDEWKLELLAWEGWFRNSHAEVVWRAVEDLYDKGISIPKLRKLTERKQEGGKRKRIGGRDGIQALVVKELTPDTVNIAPSLRKDLQKWKVGLWEDYKTRRANRVIDRLQDLVPPRIQAAILRSWKNGWCTRRRFGTKGDNCCAFGCKWKNTDSLEHYMICPVIHKWSRAELRTEYSDNKEERGASFMLLNCDNMSGFTITISAIRLAAAYRTYNLLRHSKDCFYEGGVEGLLLQSAREAVAGHEGAARCFHHRQDPAWR